MQCYITTLTFSCSYTPSLRQLQTVPQPSSMGAVSLQGSGYYICCCICFCALCSSHSACSTRWVAQGALLAQQSGQWPCCRPRAAVAEGLLAQQQIAFASQSALSSPLLRCADGARLAVISSWLEDS